MGVKKQLGYGILLGLLFAGCASMFTYPFYELDEIRVWDGVLKGDKPEHNLKFSVCIPSDANKNPCFIMLKGAFYQMKADYQDLENKLKKCEESR